MSRQDKTVLDLPDHHPNDASPAHYPSTDRHYSSNNLATHRRAGGDENAPKEDTVTGVVW